MYILQPKCNACQFSHCSGDCGNLAVFVTSLAHTKLCLSQTIPHCKGEQNYEGVTLFVRTDICSVQDQVTVSAANSDSYTESNISYVTCYTSCACDVNKHGVTSNKKHTETIFSFGYKTLFF